MDAPPPEAEQSRCIMEKAFPILTDPARTLDSLPDLMNIINIDPDAGTPERVHYHTHLKTIPSRIPGAGRGLMACGKVPSDSLIFEIRDPMFAVVEDGEYMTKTCCDNCFATIDKDSRAASIMTTGPLKFAPCGACRVAYYCSKLCQAEAWKHHHKYECKSFKRLREASLPTDPDRKDAHPEDTAPMYQARYRLIIRLVCMASSGALPPKACTEIAGLYSNEPKDLTYHEVTEMMDAASLLQDITSRLDVVEQMDELWYMVALNDMSMWHPLFRPWGAGYKYDSEPVVKAARFLDPFVALMNHSCEPNAAIYCEGRNVRVVSTREIAAREELTISYVPHTHYKVRQLELQKRWGFKCTCGLCMVCSQSMHGGAAYFHRILFAEPSDPQMLGYKTRGHGDRAIDDAVTQITTWHIGIHYKNLFLKHCRDGDRVQALRAAIQVYCLGPFARPTMREDELQDAAYHLIHLLEDQDIELSNEILDTVRLQIYLIKNDHIGCQYGHGSLLALHEHTQFTHAVVQWQAKYDKTWQPSRRNADTRREFARDLNMLMDWAGIPPASDEGMIRMGLNPNSWKGKKA